MGGGVTTNRPIFEDFWDTKINMIVTYILGLLNPNCIIIQQVRKPCTKCKVGTEMMINNLIFLDFEITCNTCKKNIFMRFYVNNLDD